MIRLEITIHETEQGIQSRTHAVKENMTDLEKGIATAVETTTACVLKNLILGEDSKVQMNSSGFVDDFEEMVIQRKDTE